jgi:hypothetical protein
MTVTAGAAAFYTGGSGLAGLPVAVALARRAVWQWRRIQSNTATTITLDVTNDNPWTTTPRRPVTWSSSAASAGITRRRGSTSGSPKSQKSLLYFYLQGKATSVNNHEPVGRTCATTTTKARSTSTDFTFPVGNLSGVWGIDDLGHRTVGARSIAAPARRAIERSVFSVQFQMKFQLLRRPAGVAHGLRHHGGRYSRDGKRWATANERRRTLSRHQHRPKALGRLPIRTRLAVPRVRRPVLDILFAAANTRRDVQHQLGRDPDRASFRSRCRAATCSASTSRTGRASSPFSPPTRSTRACAASSSSRRYRPMRRPCPA